jgi:glutamate racemase
MPRDAHIVVTDSGLGGLSICAAIEQGLRGAGQAGHVRLTYVNAWPFEDRGYNDLPDAAARARVFDAALARMSAMRPDRILIACNTLSILYPHTSFSRQPPVAVQGIVGAGVDLFAERLTEDPAASIVLTGTKTTIESGVHRDSLLRRGIDPGRIAAVSWHGLAGAIERDVDGPRTAALLDACAARAAEAAPRGATLFAGLCCTHYGYVAVRIVDAIARRTGRRVRALDPNLRLVGNLLGDAAFFTAGPGPGAVAAEDRGTRQRAPAPEARGVRPEAAASVEVVSKVPLDHTARHGISRLVAPVSPATAAALLSYALVPDLF